MRNKNAVTELLATILLLFIAVLAFSFIYFQISSNHGPTPETHVNLVGIINGENITLLHKGGESIDANNTIAFTIGGEKRSYLIKDYLIDENNDEKWDFGEKVIYNFTIDLYNVDQYQSIGVQATDKLNNAITFQGPISTNYKSDVGLSVKINNSHPVMNQLISINVCAWCLGGDVKAAGGVIINCTLPDGLDFVGYSADQGTYNNATGMWNLGNLLVEDSPVNLTIRAKVTAAPYHEATQLGLIFEGSDYTSGSVSVWQNTYLSGLRFTIDDATIFPHDGSVELTIVSCGGTSPPQANLELPPTIITESNYFSIGQDIRNTPYPGGYAPMSSGIRLITDQIYNSANFLPEKRQVVLLVTSGNPDCIWDKTTGNGYGAILSSNKTKVQMDTRNAVNYLNSTFDFNLTTDELNAVTVAKTNDLRNSSFMNQSIVMPQPGNIYNILHPIDKPGWVYEVEPGKDQFQNAFSMIIQMLLNSVRVEASLYYSTTIDTNNKNNYFTIYIEPTFV